MVIPLTVLDFLCIHPFTDGNGRIARLLTLLLLYPFEYNVGRYISLERIFEESGQTYYVPAAVGVALEKEPYATTMQKLTVGIVKWLPIESQL